MKWNIRITILYLSFVALIVTLVVKASSQKVDLVTDDYYKKELAFQKQLDCMDQSSSLKTQPEININKDTLALHFPKQFSANQLSGNVVFYRPSDISDDWSTTIKTDPSCTQHFACKNLKKGIYTVQISWSAEGKNYYNELPVYVP